MHQIKVKLFAHLTQFMPQQGVKGEAPYECPIDSTKVPGGTLYAVLFIHPDQRDVQSLAKGDTLAVWPPIAGG